jgi:acetyl esterase/lipase
MSRRSSTLWPEEYDDLREEARKAAVGSKGEPFDPIVSQSRPADREARVAALRSMTAGLKVESPEGTDEPVAGVPCRVFRVPEPRGTYVHFHGGAFLLGDARNGDISNSKISKRLNVDVVSVDYRLAPEHPYPAGSDDCLAVAKSVIDSSDGPVVLGGESAGAYLAALTMLRLRDETKSSGRVGGLNLVCGVYDLSGTPSSVGMRASDVPDVLEDDLGDFVLDCYLPGWTRIQARDPQVSPLYADLRDLPPALFSVGSADHLLDDSLFMAARWRSYGNDTEVAVYPDCNHAFMVQETALARRASEHIADFLRSVIGT